eukprot:316249_1
MYFFRAIDSIVFRRFASDFEFLLMGHIHWENHSLWTVMMANEIQNTDIMHDVYVRFMKADKRNEVECEGLIALSNRLIAKWAPKGEKLAQYKLQRVTLPRETYE